ncbi:carbonic anhydrase [Microthyrium microscopicum]|uniref:Carbonic anhydrase n=1 Tax=Microthyrium microscopicum TaxID=703497 RepID=A0A6A6UDR9_9PEZI|nr:carbonic anhydrase [Microthyrium microscopicum]
MPTLSLEDLVQRNIDYAPSHTPMPTLEEAAAAGGDMECTLVITCVDFRVRVEEMLQLNAQDKVLVCRNPGGRVAAAMEQIMLFKVFLSLKRIVVIHHSDCGASHFKDHLIREALLNQHPDHPEIENMVFGSFDNLEQGVRDDLEVLKNSPFVPEELKEQCFGYTYDIKTGLLSPVH